MKRAKNVGKLNKEKTNAAPKYQLEIPKKVNN